MKGLIELTMQIKLEKQRNELMNWWVVDWWNEWMNESLNEWVNGQLMERINEWNEQMNKRENN